MSANHKHFRSPEDIQRLLKYPQIIKHASENRLAFTLEFRTYIWNTYGETPKSADVREALSDLTGDSEVIRIIGSEAIRDVAKNIIRNGKPKGAANGTFGVRNNLYPDPEYDQFLLSRGYLQSRNGGFAFTDKFRQILTSRPENQDVRNALSEAGIDPDRLGYQRFMTLIREDRSPAGLRSSEKMTLEDVMYLQDSPFIQNVTTARIRYSEEFDLWAARLRRHIDCPQILILFGIDASCLSPAACNRLFIRIRYHRSPENALQDMPPVPGTEEQVCLFLMRYMQILLKQTRSGLKTVGRLWKKLSCDHKLKAGQILKDASSCAHGYSITSLLKAASVSRSSWYGIWSEGYGASAEKRKQRDLEDAREIRAVCEYRGFKKGSRQVRLQMIRKTGRTISLERVRRLMKENGCACTVRARNPARITARKMVETCVKPNILSRQFRLGRPGEVILTDVSYLDYGPDRDRACLSALKDPASGKILALHVSSSQDSQLSELTLQSLPVPASDGALFHSDQGTMYLNSYFQKQLANRGYEQSMSRRGNCWDNSSMESFFGHFKDECLCCECGTLEELDRLLQEYAEYYNTERPQPCRENLTPAEFEKKLLDMNESEWAEYLCREQLKYNRMVEKAAESAAERARIDQTIVRRSRYGRKKHQEKQETQQAE